MISGSLLGEKNRDDLGNDLQFDHHNVDRLNLNLGRLISQM